jgi:polyisoprenoid-binding protein YceI
MKSEWKLTIVGVALLVALPLALIAQEAKSKGPAAEPKEASAAATGKYKVDPVHSSNVFCIKHVNVTNFYGRFNEMSGTFALDDADPAKDAFEVTIQTGSVDTRVGARDTHLKSAEFFDAEKFPEMKFKSTAVKRQGGDTLSVTGDFTLRGVTKSITVPITLTGTTPGMKGQFLAGCEATFLIKRSDYGVGKPPGLGDEVKIIVSLEGVRE